MDIVTHAKLCPFVALYGFLDSYGNISIATLQSTANRGFALWPPSRTTVRMDALNCISLEIPRYTANRGHLVRFLPIRVMVFRFEVLHVFAGGHTVHWNLDAIMRERGGS